MLQVPEIPEGRGPIWLDDVQCACNDTRLTDCYHNEFGVHNCIHSEDIGVICQGNTNQFTYTRHVIFWHMDVSCLASSPYISGAGTKNEPLQP